MNKQHRSPEINLTNQCYDEIQELIINGTFTPGKKLKVEELKQQLNSGASPIREALSRLVTSGLVEAHDNKGFYVTEMSEANVRDLYHTFLQIELLALTQAIKHGDDAWKTSIVATLYNLSLIEKSPEPVSYRVWAERNYAFHVALISGCNSPTLLGIRASIYRLFDRYCRVAFNLSHTQLHINHEEHKNLAEAVLNRDLNKTTELITHHILGALEDVINTLKENNIF
jgi:GntR family transcriptional regulator, carbon starvation induced regulator